jgi:hypothetical protein
MLMIQLYLILMGSMAIKIIYSPVLFINQLVEALKNFTIINRRLIVILKLIQTCPQTELEISGYLPMIIKIKPLKWH